MKRLLLALIIVAIMSSVAFANGVTCTSTAVTPIYVNTSGAQYKQIIIENQTPSVPVYISNTTDDSSSGAALGLQLSTALGITVYIGSAGTDSWYCITGSSTASVSFTIRR